MIVITLECFCARARSEAMVVIAEFGLDTGPKRFAILISSSIARPPW